MKTTFWQNWEHGFYFRVLGYGLSFERDQSPSFSERYGHRKVLRVRRWAVQWITRKSLCLSADGGVK